MRTCALTLAALALTAACTRTLPDPPERLESFAVHIDTDVTLRTPERCGGSVPGECAPSRGSPQAPLPYSPEAYVTFFVDIEAIGSKGARPLAWSGQVDAVLPRGQLPAARAPIALVDGKAQDVPVRIRRTAGTTTILIEDRIEDANEAPPTHAVGASEHIYFDNPTVRQIQESPDEGDTALHQAFVELTRGNLVVTRVTASGFNIQDTTEQDFGGLFVFTYSGVEGLAIGSNLWYLAGSVTEYIGSTQMQNPRYAGPYIRCLVEGGRNEGFEDTEVDESGMSLIADCATGTTCAQIEEQRDEGKVRLHRCVPDSEADRRRFDRMGRVRCDPQAPACDSGTTCQQDPDEGVYFCQVPPVAPPVYAWPYTRNAEWSWPRQGAFPYCGPYHSETALATDPLAVERYEDRLIELVPAEGYLALEGLPVCRHVDDLKSVRSSCFISDAVPDCTLARAGERLLRNKDGQLCTRAFQACAAVDRDGNEVSWRDVSSTCNTDQSLPYCDTAEPGQEPLRDNADKICRSTMDDFMWGGYEQFGQFKVSFMAADGQLHCATVIADAVPGFDPMAAQESPGLLKKITGTLKQVRFRTGSSFWVIEARRPQDIEHLSSEELSQLEQ